MTWYPDEPPNKPEPEGGSLFTWTIVVVAVVLIAIFLYDTFVG